MNPFTQVLAVIAGLLIMGGAVFGYSKLKVDGFIAFIIALGGMSLVAYGIGGTELLQQLNK